MTTIKLKNGSGAPTAGDLAQGEPALDLTNKRLYTEDSGGTVIEVGTNPTSITTGDITATGTATFANLATSGDVTFGDNDKAIFGAGSDLQIYHDGSHSYVEDAGAGNLILKGGADVIIRSASDDSDMLRANIEDSVQLYFNGSEKLATTSTGIDVTGTVTADGLTVNSGAENLVATFQSTDTEAQIALVDTTGTSTIRARNDFRFHVNNAATPALKIDSNNDISFYEDTGTTASLVYTAASTSLKLTGRESSRTSGTYAFEVDNSAQGSNMSAAGAFNIKGYAGNQLTVNGLGDVSFYDDSGTAKLFWDASAEALGIGTSSIDYQATNRTVVHVEGSAGALLAMEDTGAKSYLFQTGNDLLIENDTSTGSMIFGTNASTERMRIDSSGQLGIGVTPSNWSSSANRVLQIRESGFVQQDNVTNVGLGRNAFQSGAWSYIADGYAQMLNLESDGAFKFFQAGSGTANNTVSFSQAMTLDASGNLLVGTTDTAPGVADTNVGVALNSGRVFASAEADYALNLNRNTFDGDIVRFRKNGSTVGSIGTANGDLTIFSSASGHGGVRFASAGMLPIDNSGALSDATEDIGQSDQRWKDLYLSGVGHINGEVNVLSSGTMIQHDYNNLGSYVQEVRGDDRLLTLATKSSDSNAGIVFEIHSNEKARFDNSGNLLVGKTSSSFNTAGIESRSGGTLWATADGTNAASFNRKTSDGAIAYFSKDGTTVGSIGSSSTSNFNIQSSQSGHVGLEFGSPNIMPMKDGALADNAVDLGISSQRFKDLYLSGGVYLGGTGSANKLDDYEEGTWDPEFGGEGSDPTVVYNTQKGSYIKVGNLVTVTGQIITVSRSGGSGNLTIKNLPFTTQSGEAPFSGIVGFNFNWVSGEEPNGALANQGSTKLLLYKNTSTNSHNEVDDILASGNTYLYFNLTYFT